jgi:hypothetical protein
MVFVALLIAAAARGEDSAPDKVPPSVQRQVDVSAETMSKARQTYLAALQKEHDRLIAALQREQEAQARLGKRDDAAAIAAKIHKVRAGELLAKIGEKPPETDLIGLPKVRAPADAAVFEGHHYKLIEEEASWVQAKARCMELGGHLATVHDAKENDFLQGLCNGQRAWLGASDELEEGKWIWVDGKEMDYANWRAGPEPDSNRNFLVMTQDGWADRNPGRSHWYLCEWDG